MRPAVKSPALLLLVGLLGLGSGCVYSRVAAPATPDFYTFGPPIEVTWSYGCALPDCGYPSRWAGNRWVYWTGTYWAYEETGRVYAWTHVRSRPAGVQYTRPRNVVVVNPEYPRYSRPYPPPVQRPPAYRPRQQPSPYTPAPRPGNVQRPKPYAPGDRDDDTPPPRGGGRPRPNTPSPNDPTRPTPR